MINYLLLILLSPIILIQGIYVRKVTPILPDPDGDREGTTANGKPLRLLILGDSAGLGVGVSHQDKALSGQIVRQLASEYQLQWKVVAKTGDSTADTITTLSKLPAESFDIALISLGVNDITSGTLKSTWLSRQQELRHLLFNRFGVKHIISSGMPPMYGFPALPHPLRWVLGRRAIEFDKALIKNVSAETNCHYLAIGFLEDPEVMSSDGFHPGEKVYEHWGQEAAKMIRKLHQE